MGLIRLLLAISVVLYHAKLTIFGFTFVNAYHAVTLFFGISGFYMALILNEKYHTYGAFIKTRLLKIFPAYWFVIFLCVLSTNINFFKVDTYGSLYLIFSNYLILGSHYVSIIFREGSELFFLPIGEGYRKEIIWNMLYIGPIWSVSVELIFYFIAPFIVVKNRIGTHVKLLFLIFLSISAYIYFDANNSWKTPWNYNLFISNAYLFALGAFSYFIYQKIAPNISSLRFTQLAILVFFLFWLVYYQYCPKILTLPYDIPISKNTLSLFLLFSLLPFLFLSTKSSKVDRFLGNLSYPIYISHFYFIYYFPYKDVTNPLYATLIFSVLLELTLIPLVEKSRIRFMPKKSSQDIL